MRKYLLLLGLTFLQYVMYAQPANDNCENAIPINNVRNFCSRPGEFTSQNATLSGYGAASCFSNPRNDVWFSFIAVATDVTILIRGATTVSPGGTLRVPEMTLYEGTCGGTLQELECATDTRSNHIVELYKGGLVPGLRYLIRVQSRNNNMGTFELCINNFNPPAFAESDCVDASVLCDKSGFSVRSVTGAGRDRRELDDAACFSNGSSTDNESNSTWYTWTCEQSGSLTFVLTPQNETDDLDFVVYELPNGINNCTQKRLLRCMASGDFNFPSRCMGPTGLRANETDNSEPAGCNSSGQNSYLAPLQMEAGKAYALIINNFTSTGNGFTIEFGGTGTFKGPDAKFILDASIASDELDNVVCVGETVGFRDSSFFTQGKITNWKWTFGVDATPINETGTGPHNVRYDTPGEKTIALTVETDLGCIVTEIATINVIEPPKINVDLSLPDCGGGINGAIAVTPSGGAPPYAFNWQNSQFVVGDNILDNIQEGTYNLIIKDAQNCTALYAIELPEDSIQLNESVIPSREPSCFGFSDGRLFVSPIKGSAPYEYNFGMGFRRDSVLNNIPAGTYSVQVRDAKGCNSTFALNLEQPDSLTLNIEKEDISCFGLKDGKTTISVGGGVGGFRFRWSNQAFVPQLTQLASGTYQVVVTDANGCEIAGETNIIEPAPIDFKVINVQDVTCNGEATGAITLEALGGTSPFAFRVANQNFQNNAEITGLQAGDYTLEVRDNRGCVQTTNARVAEPSAFFVDAGTDLTIELGDDTQLNAVPNPLSLEVTYQWSPSETLSCSDCPNPIAKPFSDETYAVTITDATGCSVTDEVEVRVLKLRPIYIPTVFSPNNDNDNDFFTLYGGKSAKTIKVLRIYSRWGELMFEALDILLSVEELGWNGLLNNQALAPAVFAFYAEVEFIDAEVIIYEGDIALIR